MAVVSVQAITVRVGARPRPAEIAALEAFAIDPSLTFVEASTIERYGTEQAVPAGASIVYSGNDEATGQINKYTRIQGYERR